MQRKLTPNVCIHLARKICEHCAFAGATVDMIGYLIHFDVFLIVLSGKFAFVVGAIGVYFLHAEEARRWKEEHKEDNSLTKEIEHA